MSEITLSGQQSQITWTGETKLISELMFQVRFSRRKALRETGLRREYWFENARRIFQIVREIRSRGQRTPT